ncbi:unnamed protein product [marine sediment metagenome]|uniref:Uncharacterized protein n=1 Tax=marine sediment metagenome TaxID=412755 RepID=X1V7N5_9ZZZZ
MDDNKVGRTITITLVSGFFYTGECLEDSEHRIVIRDIHGDRVEISKSAILVSKEAHL